jgi:hypothetical protein
MVAAIVASMAATRTARTGKEWFMVLLQIAGTWPTKRRASIDQAALLPRGIPDRNIPSRMGHCLR